MEQNLNETKDFIKLQQKVQMCEISTSKFKWITVKPPYIYEFDLASLKKSCIYNIMGCKIGWAICVCPLPNNKVFCFSSFTDYFLEMMITFIIDENLGIQITQINKFTPIHALSDKNIVFEEDADDILQTVPRSFDSFASYSIYYDNFVYILSEFILGFDLIKGRWHLLIKSDKEYNWCTCILFKSMILAIEKIGDSIYVIDPLIMSISSFSLPLGNSNNNVMLFSFGNLAYLVDFMGKIWESGIDNPFNWSIVKEFKSLDI